MSTEGEYSLLTMVLKAKEQGRKGATQLGVTESGVTPPDDRMAQSINVGPIIMSASSSALHTEPETPR